MFDKKRIFITGCACSGKDYLIKKFENRGYTFGVYYTTRPKREGEIEGVDYHYISVEYFIKLIDENKLKEYTLHNNWYYGLSSEEFDNKDVFIISMKSYLKYSKEDLDKIFKIFLDINEDVRRNRLEKRNDVDDVDRRLSSDREDLNLINKEDFDLVIKNEIF